MIMILCKTSVTNNVVTHRGQEKEKRAKETREDTHRGTILGVRVKSVGKKRDKSFAFLQRTVCIFVAHHVCLHAYDAAY